MDNNPFYWTMTLSEEYSTPTAENTLRVIEALLANPDGLSPQDLLAQIDTSRSSLYLLLRTLKNMGYVEQSEKRGRYRAGTRLIAWRDPQASGAQQLMAAFYQEVGASSYPETLALLLPAPDGVMVVAQIEANQQIRSVFSAGQVYKGISAAEQLLMTPPPPQVAAVGYAVSREWDCLNLAVPICKDGANPNAILLLSAPSFRMPPESLTPDLLADIRTLAARLSYRLGAVMYKPFQIQKTMSSQPFSSLSESEINTFLKGPWTARLACVRPDGRPHVIPVWQEWDGRGFQIIAWKGSQWMQYILQSPHVSLTIDEPWVPLRRVTCRGKCTPLPDSQHKWDQDNLERLVNRLVQRYLGQPASRELITRVERAYWIEPENMKGWRGIPG
jgi:DNA-binding IclR family transcriptional regulator/nitroimidazol reductase NimA-like FMN-containing flavoprotein (pyridoxamine 5'-phosphate oxidase superfamily)